MRRSKTRTTSELDFDPSGFGIRIRGMERRT